MHGCLFAIIAPTLNRERIYQWNQ